MKSFQFAAVAVCAAFACLAQSRPEWDDLTVLQIGTEKPHATMMVYHPGRLRRRRPRQVAVVQAAERSWKFHGSMSPPRRPVDFYRPEYSDTAWRRCRCRRAWRSGYGIPIYTNIIYPFPQDPSGPPLVPHDPNRSAAIALASPFPPDWKGRQVCCICGRRFRLLRVGERAEGRLQRGQPHARRVRHHDAISSPAPTCWRSRSTASATAPSSKTRTCGG